MQILASFQDNTTIDNNDGDNDDADVIGLDDEEEFDEEGMGMF